MDQVYPSLTYVNPIYLYSLSPPLGPAIGGTVLRLNGSNFMVDQPHVCRFFFSTSSVVTLQATVVDNTTVECITPIYPFPLDDCSSSSEESCSTAAGSGGVNIVVSRIYVEDGLVLGTGDNDATAASSLRYWYTPTLIIDQVIPRWVPEDGDVTVTVYGQGMIESSSGYWCRIGAESIGPAMWLNETTLDCLVPPGTPGTFAEVQISNNLVDWSLSAKGGLSTIRYEPALMLLSLQPSSGE